MNDHIRYHNSNIKYICKYKLIEVCITYMEPCYRNTYQQKKFRERCENIIIEVDITYEILPYKYKLTKNIIHITIFNIRDNAKIFQI